MLFLYIKICYRFVFLKNIWSLLWFLTLRHDPLGNGEFTDQSDFFLVQQDNKVLFSVFSIWKQSFSCLSHSALDMSGGSCSTNEEKCWGLEQTGGCVDWGGLGLRCGWACSDRGFSRCLWRQGAAGRKGIAVVSLALRQWRLASLASWASSANFPGWGAPSCRPVRFPLHSRQQSSPGVCSPNPSLRAQSASAPRHTTQPGACRTAALTPRAVLCPALRRPAAAFPSDPLELVFCSSWFPCRGLF